MRYLRTSSVPVNFNKSNGNKSLLPGGSLPSANSAFNGLVFTFSLLISGLAMATPTVDGRLHGLGGDLDEYTLLVDDDGDKIYYALGGGKIYIAVVPSTGFVDNVFARADQADGSGERNYQKNVGWDGANHPFSKIEGSDILRSDWTAGRVPKHSAGFGSRIRFIVTRLPAILGPKHGYPIRRARMGRAPQA